MIDRDYAADFSVETCGGTPDESIFSVCGSLDWHSHVSLETALRPHLLPTGPRRLLLDLSAVPYLDSTGLATLVRVHTALRQRGGCLVLRNCPPAVKLALDRTHLDQLFVLSIGK